MAAKKSATKKAANPVAAAPQLPIEVKEVKAGKPVKDAQIEVRTGTTEGRKFLITVRQKSGRPVLIAVHL
jgi:hypothetical protein